MNLHGNAKLTPKGRLSLARSVVEGTLSLSAAASTFDVSLVTARKWVRRFEADGPGGLQDRSSRPATLRAATAPQLVEQIEQLHHQHLAGTRIAALTGVSSATVSRVLKRLRLSSPMAETSVDRRPRRAARSAPRTEASEYRGVSNPA